MSEYSPEQTYKVAICLLTLKKAWNDLVAATTPLSDLDLSDAYPFGPNEFENMNDAISAWCLANATRLLNENPVMIRNPQCLFYCPQTYKASKILPNQVCSDAHEKNCWLHPLLPLTHDTLRAACKCLDIDVDNVTDDVALDKYNKYLADCHL